MRRSHESRRNTSLTIIWRGNCIIVLKCVLQNIPLPEAHFSHRQLQKPANDGYRQTLPTYSSRKNTHWKRTHSTRGLKNFPRKKPSSRWEWKMAAPIDKEGHLSTPTEGADRREAENHLTCRKFVWGSWGSVEYERMTGTCRCSCVLTRRY